MGQLLSLSPSPVSPPSIASLCVGAWPFDGPSLSSYLSSCLSPVSHASSCPTRLQDKISLHPEVADALQTHKPVVALETAILTHGMPFPYNLEVTLGLSKIIRDAGAIPATIALVDGVPKVGLTKEELTRLADPSFPAVKVSRRDLAPAMALRKDGGALSPRGLVKACSLI